MNGEYPVEVQYNKQAATTLEIVILNLEISNVSQQGYLFFTRLLPSSAWYAHFRMH